MEAAAALRQQQMNSLSLDYPIQSTFFFVYTMTERNLKQTSNGRRRRTLLCISILTQSLYYSHGWSPLKFASRVSTAQPLKSSSRIKRVLKKFAPFSAPNDETEVDISLLQSENFVLRDTIRQLEEENQKLKQRNKIVLETFEGESLFRGDDGSMLQVKPSTGITLTGDEIAQDELWCDELDGDQCPVEPSVSFGEALRDRAYWLVGLLIMQSFSGIILSRNEALLADHPVIVYFLTMLVGAGGNAGNQASVRGKEKDRPSIIAFFSLNRRPCF